MQRARIEFDGLEVLYDQHVLTPRQWTVAQSHWARDLLSSVPAGPVLELCCGVGHIGLAAVARAPRDLVLVDLNPAATALAAANAAAAGLADRVDIRTGLMDTVLAPEERFPLIIADPPWVASDEIGRFPEDPQIAIDGGPDGLDLARLCCRVVADHLADGGSALLQLGSTDQADAIADHVAQALSPALRVVEVRQHPRGVLARITHAP
jgi:methylase of polypeptide subunit release factors